MVGEQPPAPDTADFDGDPLTDQFVLVAWIDIGENWPGSEPVTLFNANFTTTDIFSDSTVIRFSGSSTAQGYDFAWIPATIQLGIVIEPTLDVDDNGQVDALTDGLLILRYLFGFRGQTLISSAVALNANRSTAIELEAFSRESCAIH